MPNYDDETVAIKSINSNYTQDFMAIIILLIIFYKKNFKKSSLLLVFIINITAISCGSNNYLLHEQTF